MPPTLLPAWLEYPTPACCALDVADAVKIDRIDASTTAIGDFLHLTRWHTWRVLRAAIAKLKANGADFEHLHNG